jgi:hypothetical protein
VPWLLLNVPVSLGLKLSPGFSRMMTAGSESDYTSLVDAHLESLGMAGFPLFPAAAGLVLLVFAIRAHAKVRASQPQSVPASSVAELHLGHRADETSSDV